MTEFYEDIAILLKHPGSYYFWYCTKYFSHNFLLLYHYSKFRRILWLLLWECYAFLANFSQEAIINKSHAFSQSALNVLSWITVGAWQIWISFYEDITLLLKHPGSYYFWYCTNYLSHNFLLLYRIPWLYEDVVLFSLRNTPWFILLMHLCIYLFIICRGNLKNSWFL